jgi:hypothetical protein
MTITLSKDNDSKEVKLGSYSHLWSSGGKGTEKNFGRETGQNMELICKNYSKSTKFYVLYFMTRSQYHKQLR